MRTLSYDLMFFFMVVGGLALLVLLFSLYIFPYIISQSIANNG